MMRFKHIDFLYIDLDILKLLLNFLILIGVNTVSKTGAENYYWLAC